MIPRIIHQMWVGSDVPPEYAEYMYDWTRVHATWKHMFWGEEAQAFLDTGCQLLWDRADRFNPPATVNQYRSDLVRYALLHKFGGVWVDMDMKPQKSLNPLMVDAEGWVAWEQPGRWVNNAVLAAVKDSPTLAKVIDGLPRASGLKGANTVKSGPQYITPFLLDTFVVYPRQYFYPYLWNELDKETGEYPDSYAVHRWNNRRSRK